MALKDGDSVKEFSTKKRSIKFQRANSQKDFRTTVGKKDAEILRLNDEVTRLKQQIEVRTYICNKHLLCLILHIYMYNIYFLYIIYIYIYMLHLRI